MRRLRPAAALAAGAALMLAVSAGAPSTAARPGGSPLAALSANRAALVVQYGDLELHRQCISFPEDEISGYELLRRSGLSLTVQQSSQGTAVCRIGRDGCSDASNCFCRYPQFWGYWTGDAAGGWTFSQQGAQATKVRDGTVQGWVWGKDGKPPPPQTRFDDVCPAAAATRAPAGAPPPTQAALAPRATQTGAAQATASTPGATTPTPASGAGETPVAPVAASATPPPAASAVVAASSPAPARASARRGLLTAAGLAAFLGASALALALLRRRR